MFYKLRQVFNVLCKTQLVCYSNSFLLPLHKKPKKDESAFEKHAESIKPAQKNEPITIACPNKSDESGGISFNLKPLYDILERKDVRDCPVVICSVNGHTRNGKSFFLNQGVKYLKYQQQKPLNPKDHSWIHNNLKPCFEWSNEISSVTDGISIWPEPFFCYDNRGKKKLCVILMDIQGLSGKTNRLNEEYKLYAFSSLISSLFIFFNSNQGRQCLESLNEFCDFSKAIADDSRPDTNVPQYKFGNLLIRLTDFAWREFPLDEGCSFYDEKNTAKRQQPSNLYYYYFQSSTDREDEEFKKKREQLVRVFDNITIATTPPFGMNMPDSLRPPNQDKGEKWEPWEPKFQAGLIKFVETVFSYEFLQNKTKKHLGNEVLGANLVPIIKSWEKRIQMPKYNITDETKTATEAGKHFRKLITEKVKYYNEEIEGFTMYSVNDDVISFHEKTKKRIHEEFCTGNHYFTPYENTYWTQLENQLDERLHSEWKHVKAKRTEKEWAGKFLFTAGAGVSSVLAMTGEPITMLAAGGLACILLASAGVMHYSRKWSQERENNYIDEITTRLRIHQVEN